MVMGLSLFGRPVIAPPGPKRPSPRAESGGRGRRGRRRSETGSEGVYGCAERPVFLETARISATRAFRIAKHLQLEESSIVSLLDHFAKEVALGRAGCLAKIEEDLERSRCARHHFGPSQGLGSSLSGLGPLTEASDVVERVEPVRATVVGESIEELVGGLSSFLCER